MKYIFFSLFFSPSSFLQHTLKCRIKCDDAERSERIICERRSRVVFMFSLFFCKGEFLLLQSSLTLVSGKFPNFPPFFSLALSVSGFCCCLQFSVKVYVECDVDDMKSEEDFHKIFNIPPGSGFLRCQKSDRRGFHCSVEWKLFMTQEENDFSAVSSK